LQRCGCPGGLGRNHGHAPVARDATPRGERQGQRGNRQGRGTRARGSWPPLGGQAGPPGPATRPRRCSGPPQPAQGATALGRRGRTTTAAGPRAAPRCGPWCTPSMGALQRGRRPRLGASDGTFQTSWRRCSPTSRRGPGLGDDIRREREAVDPTRCPALSGYSDKFESRKRKRSQVMPQ